MSRIASATIGSLLQRLADEMASPSPGLSLQGTGELAPQTVWPQEFG
jgi:hypothetical protein